MKRTDSVTGIEDVVNRNTAWLNERGGWLIFIVVLFLTWLVLVAFSLPSHVVWTAVTLAHGFLTLYFMHFRLGSPFGGFFGDDGRYDSLTWWEQIDNGEQNTNNRKFLTLIPLVLLIVTFKVTSDAGAYLSLGCSVFVSSILLIAKTPAMYVAPFRHIIFVTFCACTAGACLVSIPSRLKTRSSKPRRAQAEPPQALC
jgi:hypothetical protein